MSETASPKKRVVKDSQIEGGEESAVRSRKKKEKKERKEAEFEDVDNVDEEMETSSKAKGYNWSAITLMLMFILPALLGGWIMIEDYMYPLQASERKIRQRITPCIEVANPSKVADIDEYARKYAGKESIIYNKLRRKYSTIEECQRI